MNGYFWGFALFALWVTPVHAHVSLRLSDGVRYRIRLRLAGLPVFRRAQEERQEEKLDGRGAVKRIFSVDGQVLAQLLKQGEIKRVLRLWRVESVRLDAHISQPDAAQTALLYAALRAVLLSLGHAQAIRRRMQGSIQSDFRGEGSQVLIRCIFSARLGNLITEAIRLAVAIRQIHNRLSAHEEERYAAASH